MTAGYSGKPLAAKLGVKPGMRTLLIAPPADFQSLLGDIYQTLDIHTVGDLVPGQPPYDYIHWFVSEQSELTQLFLRYKAQLDLHGMLWISWPKKAARIATDVSETNVRQTALENGLVDIKVCAIDAIWSGLKHVYRVSDRS